MDGRALLEGAVAAATAAGRHALAQSHRRMEHFKRTAHDVKLALDVECQREAERVVRERFPGHAILGEEGGALDERAEACWIIDPIDGTVNFSHGLPIWCNSVAVQVAGQVVAGAVFVPAMNELFTATLDGPAEMNGRPIRVSDTARLEEALIVSGMGSESDEECLEVFRKIGRRVQKLRIPGAAAVDLCWVACGRADLYLETSIRLWDIAAAGLIVRRAGGADAVLRTHAPLHYSYAAGNAGLLPELVALLNQAP